MDLSNDKLREVVEGHNALLEYLRRLAEKNPSGVGLDEALPENITVPSDPGMPDPLPAPQQLLEEAEADDGMLLPEEGAFPITLAKTAGTAVSDDTTQADWTYTVTKTLTGEELGTAVNPTAGNHKWVRPTVGHMTEATFGYAHYAADGAYIIGWINEVADGAACG